MDTGEGEEWVSIPTAALRRGITQQAIGKAVRQGRIRVRGIRRKREVLWQEISALVSDKRGLPPGVKPVGANVRTQRTAEAARQNGRQHKTKVKSDIPTAV